MAIETGLPALRACEVEADPVRTPVRDEIRPARGLLVGLALSCILWLSILVILQAV